MAPIVIPILKRTEVNASFLAGAASQSWALPTINTVGHYYATLVARVHEATWSGASTLFRVEGFASYPTPEDGREFADTSARIAASVLQSAALPGFAVGTDSNLPIAYKFVAKLTQTTTSAALFVVVSADLLLRPV